MGVDAAQSILEVPVIDISALIALADDVSVGTELREDNPALRDVIANVRAAAAEWGFFYIRNHGISEAQLEHFRSVVRSFFALPKDVKNTVRRSASNMRGYYDAELTKQRLDNKEVFDVGGPQSEGSPETSLYERIGKEQNQWPSEDALPGFRKTVTEYFADMTHIARRLTQVFAVALGERFDFFDQFFHQELASESGEVIHDHTTQFRLNYYPPAPEPEKTMGVYHHTDSGAVTVLLQDDEVASLQVFHRESQTWVDVPPIKNTYVINIGDMVQVWSNDKFIAPLHRVKASHKARYSAPFFYFPSYSAVVEPIVVREDEKPLYRPISWREFRGRRYDGNVADLGVEIQISQFRIE